MLSKQEIQDAPSVIDSIATEMWLALIRQHPDYKANVVLYPDVEATLDEASGDTKGKMLNALLTRIEELGIGVVEIKNGDEGLQYSQRAERDAMVAYALSILYPVVGVVYSTVTGSYGDYQVRQRSCNYCGCLAHTSWCRYYGIY
jgi:hypothetical protein